MFSFIFPPFTWLVDSTTPPCPTLWEHKFGVETSLNFILRQYWAYSPLSRLWIDLILMFEFYSNSWKPWTILGTVLELFKLKKRGGGGRKKTNLRSLDFGGQKATSQWRTEMFPFPFFHVVVLGFLLLHSFPSPLKVVFLVGLSVLVLVVILAWWCALLCIIRGLLPAHKSVGRI